MTAVVRRPIAARARRPARCGIPVTLLAAAIALGCGSGDSTEGEPAAEGAVERSDPPGTTDSAGAVPPDPAPPSVPTLPGEGEPRRYRLLLLNRTDTEVYAFASAGAAQVVLDTVPAADSVRVDVRVRAGRVNLEARDAGGRLIVSGVIELVVGVVNRWEIRVPPNGPVALGPSAFSASRRALVPPRDAEYPRVDRDAWPRSTKRRE